MTCLPKGILNNFTDMHFFFFWGVLPTCMLILNLVCLDTAYYWKLKTYYWKHCNKITFKCVNSIVRPSFEAKFVFFLTCGSHEQCTRPREKTLNANVGCFQCNPNSAIVRTNMHIKLSIWQYVPCRCVCIGLGSSYTWCNSK